MSDTTPPGKKSGNQLSDMAIRELLRSATPRAVQRLVELVESKHPAVAMGAAKVILSKVVPDLKATELSGPNGTTPTIVFSVMSQQAKEKLEQLYEGSGSTNS